MPPGARVALCITGQLRSLAYTWVQDALRSAVLEPLVPASFMQVSGEQKGPITSDVESDRAEYTSLAEVRRIVSTIRPVGLALRDDAEILAESAQSPAFETLARTEARSGRGASCGPYSSCAPLLLRFAACARDIKKLERWRRAAFSWVMQTRPDLLWSCRFPDLALW